VAEILAKKNLLQKELSESNVKTVKIPSPPADEQEGPLLNYQIRSIEILPLNPVADSHPICLVGSSKGGVYILDPETIAPKVIYQD